MQGEGNHLKMVIVLLMEALFKASAVDSAPWFSYQSSLHQREKTDLKLILGKYYTAF